MTLLSVLAITNITWSVLSAIALHEKTGGGFQVLAICFGIFSLFTIIGCLCHQFASRDDEASNMRNVGLFGFCGLLSFALAISLTVHARQDGGQGLCNDFAHTENPTVPAGVQLGMVYVSPVLGESYHARLRESKLTTSLRISFDRLYRLVDGQVPWRRASDAAVSDYKGTQLALCSPCA
ncbi:hypothetical protein J3R82DRAFT_5562 [Butyriboletus roseoflavus]|nr:hypothetical protein J3R82DRAFT_5562 [Butyriboletus roseoflavus]